MHNSILVSTWAWPAIMREWCETWCWHPEVHNLWPFSSGRRVTRQVAPSSFCSVAALVRCKRGLVRTGAVVSDGNWKTTGDSKHSSPSWTGWTISVGEGSKLSWPLFCSPVRNSSRFKWPSPQKSMRFKIPNHGRMPNHNPHKATLECLQWIQGIGEEYSF